METFEGNAYCVKCKEIRDFDGIVKTSDSGRRMAIGKCPVCGTKVNRILGKVNVDSSPEPEYSPGMILEIDFEDATWRCGDCGNFYQHGVFTCPNNLLHGWLMAARKKKAAIEKELK